MEKAEFCTSLKSLKREGNLRASELSWWFEKPQSTVQAWLNGRQMPGKTVVREAVARMGLLREAIFTYHLFPIPSDIHFTKRKAYVEHARTNPGQLVSTRASAGKRLEMRLGTRAGRQPKTSVGIVDGGVD